MHKNRSRSSNGTSAPSRPVQHAFVEGQNAVVTVQEADTQRDAGWQAEGSSTWQ